ncbi:hypothetical protein D3C77_319970 [compost metagenome]
MHIAIDAGNIKPSASVFGNTPNLSRRTKRRLSQCGDQPLPWIESSYVGLSPVAPQVRVVARLLKCTNDVEVFAAQAADALIKLFKREGVLFSAQITPAALNFNMFCNLVSWRQEMIDDCCESYSRTNPCPVALKVACLTENSCSTDQKNEAENPLQMPVKLDVACIQLDGVVDIQACFVVSAAVAHLSVYLAGGRRWRRLGWRVSVHRHLCPMFYILAHEGSLLMVWVLGSLEIVACESSPFPLESVVSSSGWFESASGPTKGVGVLFGEAL